MSPRRAHLLVWVFVSLLAFHLWLLYRMVTLANWAIAGLLIVAIGLFAWRIVHYARVYFAARPAEPLLDAAAERRQIRTMVPVLAGLLALHAWLLTITLSVTPLTLVEYVFAALLLIAVIVFVARLAYYARRWSALRKAD